MATRINLCTNPNAATAITNYASVAGTGGTAAATYNAGIGYLGVAGFARVTWSVATSAVSGGISYTQTGLAAATQYAHQMWVRSSKTQTVSLTAVYRNAGLSTVNTVVGSSVALVANVWTQVTVIGTSGALVTNVVLTAQAVAGGANWAIADTFDGEAVLIEAAAAVGNYFDGNSASAAWNGAVNASTSTLYIPVITLTPSTDPNVSPQVLVVVTDMAPQVRTVNVQRTAEGRTMKVRGGVNLYAVGGAPVMDFEPPAGPSVYQAEQFDINGLSLGFTNPSTVTLTFTDTWVHQPLSPTLAVKVRLFIDSANDLVRPSPGSVVYPEGATVGRLIGGQRVGLRGTSIRLRMANAADADEFLSMFGGYTSDFPSVICIRTPTTIRLPRVLFAGCLDPHEVDYGNYAMITMAMTIDEVAPPAPGLVLPTLRRKDIDAAFPTRAARAAAYATRLARDVDYSKSGLAG